MGGLIGTATTDKTNAGLATAQSQAKSYAINNTYLKITAPNQYSGFVADMYWYSGGFITHETLTHCGANESVDTVERSNNIGNVYYRNANEVVIKPKMLTNTQCILTIPLSVHAGRINVELISASAFDSSEYTIIS